MKSRVTGFSRDKVCEVFSLFERTVEHKVNVIRMYAYKVDETALTTFLKNRKVI
jgi:hypothetical protein